MNSEAIIAAEAVIRSNRSDYQSPLTVDTNLITNNAKVTLADPNFVKNSLDIFKKLGFRVSAVSKLSLSLLGIKSLFEATFNITLTPYQVRESGPTHYQVEANQEPKLISVTGSELEGIVEVIILTGHNQLAMQTVDLSVVKTKLEFSETLKPKGGVAITVIEEGCNLQHQFFNNVDANLLIVISPNLLAAIDTRRTSWRNAEATVDGLENTIGPINEQTYKVAVQERDAAFEEYKRLSNFLNSPSQDVPDGHGTAVVAILSQIAPPASEIAVYSDFHSGAFNFITSIKQSLVSDGTVVNISLASYAEPANIADDPERKLLKVLFRFVDNQKLFVICSGNNKYGSGSITNRISTYTQIPLDNVIVVGGAYYTQEDPQQLLASDVAHGINHNTFQGVLRAMPDVCGICGPKQTVPNSNPPGDFDYIRTPNAAIAAHEYSYRNGTSFAAPQISGLAASIEATCPSATPAQIKEIIMRTSIATQGGTSAQGISLQNIDNQVDQDTLHPGLANYRWALLTAQKYSAYVASQNGLGIKDAAGWAKKYYKNFL